MFRFSRPVVRVFAIGLMSLAVVALFNTRAEAAVGVLLLNNHGCGCVDVFIDGDYAGHVEGHRNARLNLGSSCGHCSDIEIRDEAGNVVWSRHVEGHFHLHACVH